MNWEAMGVIAEIVGAAGVIITLAYLAMQIKQNTNQLHGEAINTFNSSQIALIIDFRDDAELVSAFIKCADNWESGSPQEQARTHAHALAYVLSFETGYNLWRSGALEGRIYKRREDLITFVLSPPGMRTWWNSWSNVFDPDFVERISQKVDAYSGNPLEDIPFYRPEHWQ